MPSTPRAPSEIARDEAAEIARQAHVLALEKCRELESAEVLMRDNGFTLADCAAWRWGFVRQGLTVRQTELPLRQFARAHSNGDKSNARKLLKRLESRGIASYDGESGTATFFWPADVFAALRAGPSTDVVYPPAQDVFDFAAPVHPEAVADEAGYPVPRLVPQEAPESPADAQESAGEWYSTPRSVPHPAPPAPVTPLTPQAQEFIASAGGEKRFDRILNAPNRSVVRNEVRSTTPRTTNNVCVEESLKDSSTQTNEQPPCGGGPGKGPPPMADERQTASGEHTVIRRAEEIYAAIGDPTLVFWAAIAMAVQERDGKRAEVAAAINAARHECCFDAPTKRFRTAKLEWWSAARAKGTLDKRFGVTWNAAWSGNRDSNSAERSRGHRRPRSPPK
ncbi:MAG: hypothetical protein DCC68_11495 [Planctomycetota bacterium]|nr:MAG: hypothetical protein DCC68_11495 [Planctomycetota bacterium]